MKNAENKFPSKRFQTLVYLGFVLYFTVGVSSQNICLYFLSKYRNLYAFVRKQILFKLSSPEQKMQKTIKSRFRYNCSHLYLLPRCVIQITCSILKFRKEINVSGLNVNNKQVGDASMLNSSTLILFLFINPFLSNIGRCQPNSEHIHASDKYILSLNLVCSITGQNRIKIFS